MNAHPTLTDADVGRMVRVDHRYGRQAGVNRGKLLALDDRRSAAAIEPLPRNHAARTVWVPVEHLHLDVKADAITAMTHAVAGVSAVVVARPAPAAVVVDHPAAIAVRPTPEPVAAVPVAAAPPPVPPPTLAGTLERLGVLLAAVRDHDARLAGAQAELAAAERQAAEAARERAAAEDAVLAVMDEGEQVRAAVRAVRGTLDQVIGG